MLFKRRIFKTFREGSRRTHYSNSRLKPPTVALNYPPNPTPQWFPLLRSCILTIRPRVQYTTPVRNEDGIKQYRFGCPILSTQFRCEIHLNMVENRYGRLVWLVWIRYGVNSLIQHHWFILLLNVGTNIYFTSCWCTNYEPRLNYEVLGTARLIFWYGSVPLFFGTAQQILTV